MDVSNMNETKIENTGHEFGEGSSFITAKFSHVDLAQPTEKANDQVGTQPTEEVYGISQSEQEELVPHMFPLGPFHHNPDSESEKIKSKLLRDRYGDCSFEELVYKMRDDGFIKEIQEWYAGFPCPLINERDLSRKMDYGDEELGLMMVRDGLALVLLLRLLGDLAESNASRLSRSLSEISRSLFSDEDGFFPPWKLQLAVQEDVMKIRNQLPLFVLRYVLQWDLDKDENYNLKENTDEVLNRILKQASVKLSPIRHEYNGQDCHVRVPLRRDSHLLEFVYENIISSSHVKNKDTLKRRKNESRVSRITVPGAEELKDKGVKFAPYSGLLSEIRFDGRNCTLYLPTIEMCGRTDAVLRNLVRFEDSKQEIASQPLMSYVDLMERLIDKTEDVQVLRKSGIIQCHLDTNKAVADVWNRMRGQLPEKIKYEPIDNAIYDVNRFYTSKCRPLLTQIHRRYFDKPWSGISLAAACILLGLTVFQTYLRWEQLRLQRQCMHKP